MTKFQVGKSYACRSLADYDCIHVFKILARTDKTITMCAVISADERSMALAELAQ